QPLPGGFLYAQPGECEALERLAAEHPCAAILFEAVQGEGGVRPIGQEFASCLQEVCRRHDLLLMADEVQLGNGRSGSLYGYMNYGLQPDVVSTAKGIGGGLPSA
ncbi:MAG: aminotransferase class III-fold pyridoxal phosphate-dependent enzyme, partial [Oscillospiraceae bacterium]